MIVIPSIDLEAGHSRIVSWPGAAAGVGVPSDRPEVIAERFVRLGARLVHVVDFDGARAGAPGNLEAIGRIASRVAVPLQVAGGIEAADHVRLAFAAGATRVVLAMGIADRPDDLAECLAIAGEWLAVGLDARPERLAAFPWRRSAAPTLAALVAELAAAGVRRFVVSHAGGPDGIGVGDAAGRIPRAGLGPADLAALASDHDAEILVAGGVYDVAGIRRLRHAGVTGVILGEPLLSGAIDFTAALEAAA